VRLRTRKRRRRRRKRKKEEKKKKKRKKEKEKEKEKEKKKSTPLLHRHDWEPLSPGPSKWLQPLRSICHVLLVSWRHKLWGVREEIWQRPIVTDADYDLRQDWMK